MPVNINGQTYYRTAEVCQEVGISRTTFFRWLKNGILEEVALRDRRGWRLFTKDDLEKIHAEATRINVRELS